MPASPSLSAAAPVRRTDRAFDAAAALCLAGGVALFVLGRRALSSLAAGTYPAPIGETWVARADLHAAQTQWGGGLVAIGVALALVSAVRHTLHKRAARR
jgi:hypothetical protein